MIIFLTIPTPGDCSYHGERGLCMAHRLNRKVIIILQNKHAEIYLLVTLSGTVY